MIKEFDRQKAYAAGPKFGSPDEVTGFIEGARWQFDQLKNEIDRLKAEVLKWKKEAHYLKNQDGTPYLEECE